MPGIFITRVHSCIHVLVVQFFKDMHNTAIYKHVLLFGPWHLTDRWAPIKEGWGPAPRRQGQPPLQARPATPSPVDSLHQTLLLLPARAHSAPLHLHALRPGSSPGFHPLPAHSGDNGYSHRCGSVPGTETYPVRAPAPVPGARI